jgi:isopenicillin N synthase-like dioxygenase
MREFYQEETRHAFIEEVKKALHDFGFFAVTHTGLDPVVIDKAFGRAEEFFSLESQAKLKYDGASTNYQRGYASVGKESAKGEENSDFKEFLHFGREGIGEYENKWPEEVPMKEDMKVYIDLLDSYRIEMQHVLALALGEKEDFFDAMTKEGDCLLRAIHYPKIKTLSDKRAVWAAEHTDIDLFTILPKATEDGLEVQLPNGVWHPVHVAEDAFVINAGDFLEIYSNGYFRSSRHRVLAPKNNTGIERYSMVYFVHPTSETMLYPLPGWTLNEPEKFAHATRIEMLMERLADLGLASDEGLKFLGESGVMERLIAVGRASPKAMRALQSKGYASPAVISHLSQVESH